jgi:hypothetical protein
MITLTIQLMKISSQITGRGICQLFWEIKNMTNDQKSAINNTHFPYFILNIDRKWGDKCHCTFDSLIISHEVDIMS